MTLTELSNYDPKVDPTTATVSIETLEEGGADVKAASKTKRKPVGRPKKTAGLANK